MKKTSKYLIFIFLICITSTVVLSGCSNTTETISVDSIQISKKNVYLAEGQTTVLSAQVYPFNANNQDVTWVSSNENIVKVEDGFVTAVKKGEAVIEVISNDGGYKDTCNILVATASDNLSLNNYNNLNMPPKELAPIYQSTTPTMAQPSKITTRKIAKNITTKALNQTNDVKQSAKNVVNQIKQELQISIDNLNSQKQQLTQNLSTDNNFITVFNNIQNEIIDGITNIKQQMINNLTQTEEKIDSDEYTVQNKNLNGVTFVVISNETV